MKQKKTSDERKPNRRPWFFATVTVIVTSLALSACGGTPESKDTSGTISGDEKVEVTTWAHVTGDRPVQEAAFERWNAENPNQQISAEFFDAAAYKPKLRTAIGAGNPPTFFYSWGGGILRSYVEANTIYDLSSYRTEHPEIFDRYITASLENNVINGKTYGIPANKVNPTFFYYNKDLFAQAGVQPPKTFDELMALIPVFKNMGIAPIALGGQTRWPELIYLEYLQNRLAGDVVFERVLSRVPNSWSDPAMIQAATMIQDLVKAGAFQEGYASTPSDSGSELALVYTGKAAMCLSMS